MAKEEIQRMMLAIWPTEIAIEPTVATMTMDCMSYNSEYDLNQQEPIMVAEDFCISLYIFTPSARFSDIERLDPWNPCYLSAPGSLRRLRRLRLGQHAKAPRNKMQQGTESSKTLWNIFKLMFQTVLIIVVQGIRKAQSLYLGLYPKVKNTENCIQLPDSRPNSNCFCSKKVI